MNLVESNIDNSYNDIKLFNAAILKRTKINRKHMEIEKMLSRSLSVSYLDLLRFKGVKRLVFAAMLM